MKRQLVRLTGLVMAPIVWAVNMQLGQILPHVDCRLGLSWTTIATLGAAFIAVGTLLLTYLSKRADSSRDGLFIARLSLMTGAAFAFALVLQGAATLLLSPCER